MTRAGRAVLLLLLAALIACHASGPLVDQLPPVSSILFLGNSITLHPPSPDIGWSGNWGMAASAQAKDYAHLLTANFPGATQSEVSITDFELNYRTFDITSLHAMLEAAPSVVVVEVGDNVTDSLGFAPYYAALIKYVSSSSSAIVLCTSTWFGSQTINAAIQSGCTGSNVRFVDLSGLHADSLNQASSERTFTDPAVGSHPGDAGMIQIAARLYAAIKP
jgi:hypothetical protein